MNPTLRRVLSSALLAVFIAALVVPVVIWRHELWSLFSSREALGRWLQGWGAWSRLAYAGLQAFQIVVFVIPGEVVQVAGGYLFGWVQGALLAVGGTVVGATLTFFAARLLGRPFVTAFISREKIEQVGKLLATRNARLVFFLLYLIPAIPKDVLGYVAGLSPLGFGFFISVSTLARLPALVGSAVMGAALARSQWVLFAIVGGAATVLFVAGLLLRPRIQGWLDRLAARRREPREP